MPVARFTQDPNARLDYQVDWSDWLLPGDSLLTSVWIPGDAALVLDGDTNDDTTATMFASFVNAVIGQRYLATNRIETVQGLKNDQSIKIKVKDL